VSKFSLFFIGFSSPWTTYRHIWDVVHPIFKKQTKNFRNICLLDLALSRSFQGISLGFAALSLISVVGRFWGGRRKWSKSESALFLGVFLGVWDWPPSFARILDPLWFGPLSETSIDFEVDRLAPLRRLAAIEDVFANIDIAVEDLPCRDFGSAQTKPWARRRRFAQGELRLRSLVSLTEFFDAPAADPEDFGCLLYRMEMDHRFD
jgi:hypothetical protein